MFAKPKYKAMKINNKDIIQSYILTAARYDWSVYEKRILYRLVEACQYQLEGKKLDEGYCMDKSLFGDYIVTMPTGAFLKDEKDEHHTAVKAALTSLRNKTIEYEDDKVWKLIGIIEKPVLEKRGFVTFELQPEIYEAILNFSKGFRKIELATAMSFDSVYTMRFYELLSGKTTPIVYKLADLKIMFKLETKYKLTADFLKRVVHVAKLELAEKAPFSFTYEALSDAGSKKTTRLKFYPYAIAANRDVKLETKVLQGKTNLTWMLSKLVVDYLMQNYYFTKDEIRNNLDLLTEAAKAFDLLLFISQKVRMASGKAKPKGWIINAIKSELKKQQTGQRTRYTEQSE